MQITTIVGIVPPAATPASSLSNTPVTIGISMPNVPHEVPVAKERPTATTNKIAGRRIFTAVADSTIDETYVLASRSPVIDLSAHANVSISIAGTICLNPSGTASIQFLKVRTLRIRK